MAPGPVASDFEGRAVTELVGPVRQPISGGRRVVARARLPGARVGGLRHDVAHTAAVRTWRQRGVRALRSLPHALREEQRVAVVDPHVGVIAVEGPLVCVLDDKLFGAGRRAGAKRDASWRNDLVLRIPGCDDWAAGAEPLGEVDRLPRGAEGREAIGQHLAGQGSRALAKSRIDLHAAGRLGRGLIDDAGEAATATAAVEVDEVRILHVEE